MRCAGVWLWLVVLAGCSTRPQVVRPDAGEGEARVFTVRPGELRPLEVEAGEVRQAVARLGTEVRPSARPLEDARRWLGVPAYSGTLYYEVRRRGVVPLEEGSAQALAQDRALVKAYLGWCERTLGPGDCLRILKDGWRLDDEGRYVWALPEPVSKGVAGAMTVVLVGYLGVDTVWGIIGGWKELVEAVDGATTFEEIRTAGEKYSQVLGERAARLFIMVGTAAVGNTAAQFSSKLPRLPRFEQLAYNVKGALHVRLGALAQVEAVAVSAEGLVVALAPGAMAMAESGLSRWQRGSGGGWQPPREGPGEWVEVNEAMPQQARDYQAQVTGAPPGHTYRVTANGEQVKFDDFQEGTLIEAKGPGYAKWIDDDLGVPDFYKGIDEAVDQAKRQFAVANGLPIKWIVAEEKFVTLLRMRFKEARLRIQVVHIEPTPKPPGGP